MSHERNFKGTTMATKTSSKTATRKPTASAAGRKTTAPHKPANVAPKTKLPKKGLETRAEPTAPARQLTSQAEKLDVSGHATPHSETVSLIDRKRSVKKSQDGEAKTKRSVLPPISRIRASLEATSKPPPPAHVPSRARRTGASKRLAGGGGARPSP